MTCTHYNFPVPEEKMLRVITDTDFCNEADDPFALVHHLLTPMFDVRGIIAAHFESKADVYGAGLGRLQPLTHGSRNIMISLIVCWKWA